ncbi:unnamed protein product [Caenorhabditis brenneri]
MLPETTEEQDILTTATNILNEPPVRNQVEDLYLFDQYAQSNFFTPTNLYTYQPQPIYYNPWAYTSPNQFDFCQNYPVINPYDPQFAPAVSTQPAVTDLKIYETSYEETCSETGKDSTPEITGKRKRSGEKGNKSYSRKLSKLSTRDVTCSNCSTSSTTLWRKNDEGNLECNACNLYFRHNKVRRPLSLCKERPATRKRRSKLEKSPEND